MTDTTAITTNASTTLLTALRAHLVVSVAMLVGAVLWGDRPAILGVVAGSVVGAANLRGLVWIVSRIVREDAPSRAMAQILLFGKMIVTCATIGVVLFVLRPSPIALTLSWSSSLVCLVLASQLRRSAPPPPLGGSLVP